VEVTNVMRYDGRVGYREVPFWFPLQETVTLNKGSYWFFLDFTQLNDKVLLIPSKKSSRSQDSTIDN
jgi:hypothetical protein